MSKQQEHPLRDIHTNSHHENRFEYVRLFEQPDNLLRETWIVVRIDGRGFHKCVFPEKWNSTQNTDARSRLSDKYKFEKPNDRRALDLMNAAAVSVMKDLPDLIIAYGVSDEYRFVVFFFWTMSHTDMTIVLCSILIAIYLRGEARTYPS